MVDRLPWAATISHNSIRHARGDWLKVSLRGAHSYLSIRAIRVLKAKLPIRVVMECVKGRQDTNFTFYEDLERLAQMTVEVNDFVCKRKTF